MASMCTAGRRMFSIGMDGHASFRRTENLTLGWGGVSVEDDRLKGRWCTLPSLSTTWPFGALAVQHLANGLWYIIHGCGDILHVKKAIVRALRSYTRTVFLGDLLLDWSGFLSVLGIYMSVTSFEGNDWMSDKEANQFLAASLPEGRRAQRVPDRPRSGPGSSETPAQAT